MSCMYRGEAAAGRTTRARVPRTMATEVARQARRADAATLAIVDNQNWSLAAHKLLHALPVHLGHVNGSLRIHADAVRQDELAGVGAFFSPAFERLALQVQHLADVGPAVGQQHAFIGCQEESVGGA